MRSRDTFGLGLTAVVVLALAAGIGYAAIPDDHGVIQGCYRLKGNGTAPKGNLRVIDPATEQCDPETETSISWNQQGPPGESGRGSAYLASTGSVALSDSRSVVLTRAVEQGSYIVTGRVEVFTGPSTLGPRWVSCDLLDTFDQAADSMTVELESTGGLNGAAGVPLLGAAQSPGGTMKIQCSVYPFAAGDYVVADAKLAAVQVGTLTAS